MSSSGAAMLPETTVLKQTPLYSEHQKLHAKIVPFGGWDMPISYEGILAEYECTRKSVGVFDTCHMGEFLIEGDCHDTGLDRIVTQRLSDMPLLSCRYGMALNDHGGMIDDLIVYRMEKNRWMIVVNGATTDKDTAHFLRRLKSKNSFKNISPATGKLDVQGPASREVLSAMIPGIQKLNYYEFDRFDFLGEKNIVSRTGYTGELGFEVYFSWDRTPELWKKILEHPAVKPAGLGARDVLRLEMCYSLYGQELDESISPLEAGLEKFIDFEKDFIGKEALLRQKKSGVKRKTIYFSSETRQSPRHNHKIFSSTQREIGTVTSGTFSPALKRGIAIGFVDADADLASGKIFFGVEGNPIPGQLCKRPFYKYGTLKS